MAMLDTLRASQQLQDAGIEAGHADALVSTFSEGFGERLATRDELHQTEARLLAEIEGVRAEIREAEQRAMNRAYVAIGAATTLLVAVISIATTLIITLG